MQKKRQLEFLKDTVTYKNTICSLDPNGAEFTHVREERKENEYEDDDEGDELQEGTSTSTIRSSASNFLIHRLSTKNAPC